MKKRFFFVSIFLVCIFSVIFGYSLVFGTSLVFSNNIKFVSKIGSSVYLDSSKLNNFIVVFASNIDISDYIIHSNCKIEQKLLGSKNNNYVFDVKVKDFNCSNKYFFLSDKSGNIVSNTNFTIDLHNKIDTYSYYIDFSTLSLNNMVNEFDHKIRDLSNFRKYDKNLNVSYSQFYSKYREYYELIYRQEIIIDILNRRETKYSIPVAGHKLPDLENKTKLPNTPRPYRDGYTVPIHQGWDIDAPLGTIVSALDDGVIVKVINNFTKDDLLKINYGTNLEYKSTGANLPESLKTNLTYEEELNNLDILRGNQVWLKTSKGDVVFYSHLNEVLPDIKEGIFVKSGTNLGTIGKTGVPGDDYDDYHLHFEVHQNPYNENLAGKYKTEDYLKWDWYFKGKSVEYIVEHQGDIFDIK